MIPTDELPGVAQRFPRDEPPRRYRAVELLQELMENEIGIRVSSLDLEHFIVYRWVRIAPLAHAIHNAPDHTK